LRRAAALLALACSLAAAPGCAPKTVTVAPAPTAPVFPELVYPGVPAALAGVPAAVTHEVAWQSLQAGDVRAAERTFAAALKQQPTFYPAEAGLGYIALTRKDYQGAVEHFDRAIAADPAYAPALVGRGEALLPLDQRDRALESFESAVAADPSLTTLRDRIEALRFRGLQEDVSAAREAAEAGRLAEAHAAYERTIAASPDSAFLYRELAEVERREGKVAAALERAQKAAALNPAEPRNFILIAELYEVMGEDLQAMDAYGAAVALEPGAGLDARIDALRERMAFAALPAEYQVIESSLTLTRAQLAALFGLRLDDLLARAPRRNAVVLTDTRGNWAAPWIQTVSRAGVMDPFPNHTFQPTAVVRRSDLAHAVTRALSLIAAENPALAATWRASRRRFPDLGEGHLSYPAASVAVESGVMQTADDGSFQLQRAATGTEALAAVQKLEELSGRKPR